ncbi:GNAT family N-acetyltransferase [Leptolyngbya sp. FACHB-36]|uniref:GNAT family N-acetyltransferase n=1 Tax=Leptolyngbya sp. FACHB-36 TaxID=2692808 RepID=UPI001680A3CE|nr:GNAT family N-acetyltransferase [Leptolyngbya sp. FACHB-36]MBD2020963.1 GNAT family N-acetyltransferase [Leptolyngbya sp. FACHB-36]
MTLVELYTDRLRLRPYTLEDLDALHALWTDPHVRRYLFDDNVVSKAWAAAAIDRALACFQQQGLGQWCVFLQETTDLIGFAGFSDVEESEQLQMLYGLHPDYWGRGFATEAVKAIVRYAFEAQRLQQIVANTDVANLASANVVQRAGFRLDKRVVENGLDLLYFSIDRLTYQPDCQSDRAAYHVQPLP